MLKKFVSSEFGFRDSELSDDFVNRPFYDIADNIPAEILARGPEAVEAYVKLRKQGNAPLFRSRVFLLGQNRASNIRFRSALLPSLNANRNKNEIENSIIECQHWCVINSKGQWKIDKNENILDDEMTSDDEVAVTDVSNQKLKSKVGLDLEDAYNKAIARNIAVEIIKAKQQQKKVHLWMFFGLWPFIMYSSWAFILV